MMFIRRDRPPVRRFTALRVGLFFFAAGLWLAGVIIGSDVVTGAALGIAALTFFFGMYLRRKAQAQEDEVEGEGEVEEPQGW